MAEPAGAEDGDQIGRAGARHLDGLVRVARAGCLDPDEDLSISRFGKRPILDFQWRTEPFDDSGPHVTLPPSDAT
jgi:hypothetical protein